MAVRLLIANNLPRTILLTIERTLCHQMSLLMTVKHLHIIHVLHRRIIQTIAMGLTIMCYMDHGIMHIISKTLEWGYLWAVLCPSLDLSIGLREIRKGLPGLYHLVLI